MTGGSTTGGDGATTATPSANEAAGGRIAANIVHFGRVLRAAGLPVGPGQVLGAIAAVDAVGLDSRRDFYWALHAALVTRREQQDVFNQAFHVFWRNPRILERMMSLVLPPSGDEAADQGPPLSPRVAEALTAGAEDAVRRQEREVDVEFDAAMTWSREELLRAKDFDKMTNEEMAAARRAMARMRLPIMSVRTRRFRADPAGARADMRATLRAALRYGGDMLPLRTRTRRLRHPPLVILCDISGSMDRYARMLIHFMHAVTNDRDRVFTFLFGTHLTNVTRYLRNKDVDAALEKVAGAVTDWSGGTRIGKCLHDFNRDWSRRVLTQGAVVLLITDGLDRDAGAGLDDEMDRLHRSCRRLIWLNPLLRYDRFEPRALGARTMLRHIDDFRPVHNLASLAALTAALGSDRPEVGEPMARWRGWTG